MTINLTKKTLLFVLTFAVVFTNAYLPCQCATEINSEGQLSEIQLIADANQKFWDRRFTCAKDVLSQLCDRELGTVTRSRLLVNMAICDAQMEDWALAEKEAKQGVALGCADPLTQSDGLLVIGRCQVINRKTAAARENYVQSLTLASQKLGLWNCDLAPIYEGLAACDFSDKNMQSAEKFYKKVAQLDYLKYGTDSTELGWSLLSLTNVFEITKEADLAHMVYKKVFWNFRHQNEERIIAEIGAQGREKKALIEELRNQLYGQNNGYENRRQGLDYVKEGIPIEVLLNPDSRPHDFNNWFVDRVGRDTAPGLAFFDPRTKLKALIVTVHGLGLHHGAFTPFAQEIQHHGFGVISFDVRGFGSYRNDERYQQVDFNAIITDMQRILSQLRRDYDEIPIFILGESMGGAIALRIAALSPQLVDGVVSSVPSGSRFHAKSTAMEVAVKFITNSHKQFNIGERVVGQATSNEDLRTAWTDDPDARMNFSASDLIKFQKFMNDNMMYAEKITKTPVIIFQGYSDGLVKPLGTLALYQAIKARDKDLIFIGHSEHLIFEEGQFDQDVMDGLRSWLDRHTKAL